jgi:hypothetical protein
LLLLLKLALVAASILGATAAARRWGHAASGLLAGLRMIIGPITALLLFDHSAERVRAILLATLQCQPAMLLHVLVFAHAARRWPWPACLALANGAYLLLAAALVTLDLAAAAAIALVALAWMLVLRAMPSAGDATAARVAVPSVELWWRLGVALVVAAGVIEGASTMPAAFGGVLLAAPITGNVLPAFTLPRHGPQATALREAGQPAEVSNSVGTFVCNHVFYALQHLLARKPSVRSGFMHLCCLPEQAAPGTPSLPLASMIDGAGIALATALAVPRDLQVSGGQLD